MKRKGLTPPKTFVQKSRVALRKATMIEPAALQASMMGHRLTPFIRVAHTNSWSARCTACPYAVTVPRPNGESREDKTQREIADKLTCLDEVRRGTEKGRAAQRRR